MNRLLSVAAVVLAGLLTACGGTASSLPPSSTGGSAAAQASIPASAAVSSSEAAKPPAPVASQGSTSGSKQAVRASYLSLSSIASMTFISKEAGLYDKYGLDVTLSYLLPAPQVQALVAGKDIDVAYSSAANIPTVNAQGADIVMIGASAQGGIFSMVAGKGINSVADLKGKQVAVRGIGSTTDLLARQVLQQNGFTVGKDVGIVALADDLTLVAAIQSGQVAAIMNSEPFTSLAVSQGAKVIFDQSKDGQRAIQTPVAVKRSYLNVHRDAMTRLLMANMEAIHLMKTKPAEVAPLTIPYIKLEDTAALTRGLEWAAKVMDDDMNIPLDNLAVSIKMAADTVPEAGKLKPEDMVDLSLLQEIKASGFLDKLQKS
jgi:ABC-type nitrate/sulfonate/bicarbonate transport system substrate-binding protein